MYLLSTGTIEKYSMASVGQVGGFLQKTLCNKPLPNLSGVWGGYYYILSCRVGIIIY